MKIPLDRITILKIYCYCRQAERSVHRVLNPAACWSDFQAYYGEKCVPIDHLRQFLQTFLSEEKDHDLPLSREVFEKDSRLPGICQIILGKLLARWKSVWRFSPSEIAFIVATLRKFLLFCRSPSKPIAAELINLRMDFSSIEMVLEWRCYGLKEFQKACHIAHFDQGNEHPGVRIQDILAEAA